MFFSSLGWVFEQSGKKCKDYHAIKNVTIATPTRYLCKWFATWFEGKRSVTKGHHLTAIKSFVQSSILSQSRTISQDHSNTLLLGCQIWMPKKNTQNRLPCLSAKSRVAAKDRNQGANGASKQTFILLRVRQTLCVCVRVCQPV